MYGVHVCTNSSTVRQKLRRTNGQSMALAKAIKPSTTHLWRDAFVGLCQRFCKPDAWLCHDSSQTTFLPFEPTTSSSVSTVPGPGLHPDFTVPWTCLLSVSKGTLYSLHVSLKPMLLWRTLLVAATMLSSLYRHVLIGRHVYLNRDGPKLISHTFTC